MWYKEGIIKDSIILAKDSIISTQKLFIHSTDTIIKSYDLKLNNANNRLKVMKRKRNNALIIGGVGIISTFFIGFFIKP